MKKILLITSILIGLITFSVYSEEFDWAKEAVDYCVENEILHGMEDGTLALGDNITNEQTAKILVSTFLNEKISENIEENDLDTYNEFGSRWSAVYLSVFKNYTKNEISLKNVALPTTREEFVSSLVLSSGLKEGNIRNSDVLEDNFVDYKEVSEKYQKLLCIAVERGYMKGDNGYINPKANITRAEACSLLFRVICEKKGEKLDLGVKQSATALVAPTKISVEQAKKWAEKRGASEAFIEIADTYWEYGEITGICPEILYAQAAKETRFGLYGGNVIPEQNNWAGIKKYGATGDAMEDHETFETPEDGVRGHFNHMSAYLGLEPIGEPHGRYQSVAKLEWAGKVKTLEELGGKWCPDLYYGYSILHNYLEPMINM